MRGKFEAMIFSLVGQKKCKQTELSSERKSCKKKDTVYETKIELLFNQIVYISSKFLI